ncbi:Histone-lysine N-methyltransferase ATXR7 [Quillaja saponaria]|uniref:Histone-lysine N-methyltransferase ATXR7 n=1 Tax=Quillaja saponaria TaxID=32244 RepID=A0AAD7M1I1_QUISA|nr:Histone-lysine N-methyltransferase ATXR7 [Quillaja saponaria]
MSRKKLGSCQYVAPVEFGFGNQPAAKLKKHIRCDVHEIAEDELAAVNLIKIRSNGGQTGASINSSSLKVIIKDSSYYHSSMKNASLKVVTVLHTLLLLNCYLDSVSKYSLKPIKQNVVNSKGHDDGNQGKPYHDCFKNILNATNKVSKSKGKLLMNGDPSSRPKKVLKATYRGVMPAACWQSC